MALPTRWLPASNIATLDQEGWTEMRKAQLLLYSTEGKQIRFLSGAHRIASAGMGFAFFPLLEGTIHG
jgi:hypothetical protein